jgi:hypothetical protein
MHRKKNNNKFNRLCANLSRSRVKTSNKNNAQKFYVYQDLQANNLIIGILSRVHIDVFNS